MDQTSHCEKWAKSNPENCSPKYSSFGQSENRYPFMREVCQESCQGTTNNFRSDKCKKVILYLGIFWVSSSKYKWLKCKRMHCKPIPVMKAGFSLWGFSHRKKSVFIAGVPCNENRFFPVWKNFTGKTLFSPCNDPVLKGLQCVQLFQPQMGSNIQRMGCEGVCVCVRCACVRTSFWDVKCDCIFAIANFLQQNGQNLLFFNFFFLIL